MKVTIIIGDEPLVARIYNYDENVDYNEKIADMVESLEALKD